MEPVSNGDDPCDTKSDSGKNPSGTKPAIRYVEARRIGTCSFADRIATLSIQHYQTHIHDTVRTHVLPQTCIATIVAAFHMTKVVSTSSSSTQQQLQRLDRARIAAIPPAVDLQVLSMGVGTKFLSEAILTLERDIQSSNNNDDSNNIDGTADATSASTGTTTTQYGTRIRDCHAEVLCRRAFRKYLFDCIEQFEMVELLLSETSSIDSTSAENIQKIYHSPILERCMVVDDDPALASTPPDRDKEVLYRIRPHVSLHMYCSSTPCGNSTIKKFASLQKEVYCTTLSNDTWPSNHHNHLDNRTPVVGHSIPLGQFALLVKKDPSSAALAVAATNVARGPKERTWPIYQTTDWCPPGTTTVWSNQGSLHTCSDKIARWNYVGYQGSLLSAYLQEPIYITTITVGRKFSSITCRRAVCCRLNAHMKVSTTNKTKKRANIDHEGTNCHEHPPMYQLHHPTVMGTGVYMDETGFIDLSALSPTKAKSTTEDDREKNNDNGVGQGTKSTKSATTIAKSSGEIRFHSPMSFVTWLQPPSLSSSTLQDTRSTGYEMECIDGSSGYLISDVNGDVLQSQVCTYALMKQFLRIKSMRSGSNKTSEEQLHTTTRTQTLHEYRKLKQTVARSYEHVKDTLLTKHPVLRDWKRHANVGIDGKS